jgi:anaphase-promoting complex subunit 11
MEAKGIYTVTKWNAVASWVSDSVSLNCSICREPLEHDCPHCMLLNDPSITCHIAKGQCCHSFHKHCLDRWFNSQKHQKCLLCTATWNPV